MRAIRLRAFILTPLLIAPTGRSAAGVTRVPLFPSRRVCVSVKEPGVVANYFKRSYPRNCVNLRIPAGQRPALDASGRSVIRG